MDEVGVLETELVAARELVFDWRNKKGVMRALNFWEHLIYLAYVNISKIIANNSAANGRSVRVVIEKDNKFL